MGDLQIMFPLISTLLELRQAKMVLADVMEDLSHNERALIFKSLNKKKAAEALIGSEPAVQESVLKNMKLCIISGSMSRQRLLFMKHKKRRAKKSSR